MAGGDLDPYPGETEETDAAPGHGSRTGGPSWPGVVVIVIIAAIVLLFIILHLVLGGGIRGRH